jgi:beta-N-acetylhexosaminidase
MRLLGERWMTDAMAATDAAAAVGHVLASELRACGVDLSFAPVLDLDHGPSTVIGDRAFHRDARVVTMLARAVMHGMMRAGMAHCAKHFPGHGAVAADSHVAVPVDRRTLKALLADDAQPYGWMSSSLMAVMPAHVVYTRVDRRPAGFSARWLQDILRERLGFTGAIFSDDLGMEAACIVEGRRVARAEAALLALDAGCDMVLLCNQSSVDGGRELDTFLDTLTAAQADGRFQPDPDGDARRRALLPQTPPLDWDTLMHDPVYRRALDLLP